MGAARFFYAFREINANGWTETERFFHMLIVKIGNKDENTDVIFHDSEGWRHRKQRIL